MRHAQVRVPRVAMDVQALVLGVQVLVKEHVILDAQELVRVHAMVLVWIPVRIVAQVLVKKAA